MATDIKYSVMKSCANVEYSKDCVNIDLEPWLIIAMCLFCLC